MTDKLHRLTVLPAGTVYEIDEKTDLLNLLRVKNTYIKSSCGGHASCSECIIKIVAGEDNLSSVEFAELKLLGNVFHITKERLACQTKITGDVTIDLSRHKKPLDDEKLKSKTSKFMKKPIVKVRKEKDLVKKEEFRDERPTKLADDSWQNHWEKDKKTNEVKRLHGGKKPKFFDTDKIDYDKIDYDRPLSKAKRDLKEELKKDLYEKPKKEEVVSSDKNFKKFRE